MKRCAWVKQNSPLYIKYHDKEWGVPVYSDKKLFEFIVLESAQAGLSWETILKRRIGYKKAFAGFNPMKVSQFKMIDVVRLMKDTRIIRNKLKILATISNAIVFLAIQKEFGSFSHYLWGWVGNTPVQNAWTSEKKLPVFSKIAQKLALDLKKRGFKFFGPTICYAHMQAVGMVNDHRTDCFRYQEIKKMH